MSEHSGNLSDALTPQQMAEAICSLLKQAPVPIEDRVQALAGAVVIEALQPYWREGRSALEAHHALRRADPELADTIEAIAPILLGRLEVREEALRAIASVEALLGLRRGRR